MTRSHKVILGCLLFAPMSFAADPPKPDGEKDEKAARMEHMKQAAKGYAIALASDATKKLTLVEEPVLRFDDQVTGVVDGTMFVWMLDDRPAATVSVWIRKTGHEFHEFQTLSARGLTASNGGEEKWTPAGAGLERKPLADAQAPAATAAGRLNQMRATAREYTATVSTSDKDQQELRLLPQPVHRYGRADGPVVDGGLFAYCKGTNPEVLLLVEAVKKGDGMEWTYAFARMTSRVCTVTRDKKEVWTAPRVSGGAGTLLTDTYFNVVQRYKGPGADNLPPKDK
jgi:hypothetical protein